MGDAPHLALVVGHDVIAFAQALGGLAHALLAEIDIAIQFAHDEQVDDRRHLRPQRRGVGQLREAFGRAQVREESELLAQAEDRLLGAQMPLERVAARIADRAEQDGIGALGEIQRLGGSGWPLA